MVSWVFGFMVPVTFLAFLAVRYELAAFYQLNEAQIYVQPINWLDWVALTICSVGVFVHNRYPQKVRTICIHND